MRYAKGHFCLGKRCKLSPSSLRSSARFLTEKSSVWQNRDDGSCFWGGQIENDPFAGGPIGPTNPILVMENYVREEAPGCIEETMCYAVGFAECDDDANPDAEAEQGGAFPVNGVLSLWDAKTQAPEEIPGSDIGIGDSIAINTPTSITIVDTDWEPYEGARTVFLGGALGGCQEHPCELGHSCAYSNYSLACSRCQGSTVSVDGVSCAPCGAGSGPNANQTACDPCTGTQYSTFGVCVECAEPRSVSPDRTACIDPYRCPGGTFCPGSLALSGVEGCASLADCEACGPGCGLRRRGTLQARLQLAP